MNDAAFFALMLAGMLGYLALIRRVLARNRRPGRTMNPSAAAARQEPPPAPTDEVAYPSRNGGGDGGTRQEERTGGNRPHT